MGNKVDKPLNSKDITYVDNLIRSLHNKENDKFSGGPYGKRRIPKVKKSSCLKESTSKKIVNRENLIQVSKIFAEMILKPKIEKEFFANENIYSSMLGFNEIAGNSEKTIPPVDGELSNISQIKASEQLLFKSLTGLRGQKFLEMKVDDEMDIRNNDNFTMSRITMQNSNKFNTIDNLNEIKENSMQIKGTMNDLSIISKKNNSLYKDRSFEDISLQEYLKMETDRLKKERVKEGGMEERITEKKSLNCEKDVDEYLSQSFENNFEMENKFNIMKNKHLEKNKRNIPNSPVLERSNTARSKNNFNTTGNKSLTSWGQSPMNTNRPSSRTKNIIRLNSLNTGKEIENVNKIDNYEYYTQRKSTGFLSPNRSSKNITSNNNHTNSVTKITTRPPTSNHGQSKSKSKSNFFNANNIKNSPVMVKKDKDKYSTTINYSNNNINTTNKFVFSKVNLIGNEISSANNKTHSKKSSKNSLETMQSPTSLTNLTQQTKKPPIACIKIDIRDLFKEERLKDNQKEKMEKLEGKLINQDQDQNKSNLDLSDIEDYINKFKNTDKSYSQILKEDNQ